MTKFLESIEFAFLGRFLYEYAVSINDWNDYICKLLHLVFISYCSIYLKLLFSLRTFPPLWWHGSFLMHSNYSKNVH